MAELTPQERQKLEAALVVLGEVKRDCAAILKRVDGIEKEVKEMLEKSK